MKTPEVWRGVGGTFPFEIRQAAQVVAVSGVSRVLMVYADVWGAAVLGVVRVWLVYAGVSGVMSFRRLQV